MRQNGSERHMQDVQPQPVPVITALGHAGVELQRGPLTSTGTVQPLTRGSGMSRHTVSMASASAAPGFPQTMSIPVSAGETAGRHRRRRSSASTASLSRVPSAAATTDGRGSRLKPTAAPPPATRKDADQQQRQEGEHLHDGLHAHGRHDERPRIHEDHLHVEGEEHHRHRVPAHVEPGQRVLGRAGPDRNGPASNARGATANDTA